MNEIIASLSNSHGKVAVILVDHGSRREDSNSLLLDVVATFREQVT
jgi:sirohydrochlorin ferrochelatase